MEPFSLDELCLLIGLGPPGDCKILDFVPGETIRRKLDCHLIARGNVGVVDC